ncbi:hypothetical protein DS2_00670 [Catenovulum agarivorans DS-2]|uniref:Lipoprotein n=1 Tax=Catenovulum agarivorans DS-2 TaxID=1328313 RepID=W7QJX1_9ALTE|nr:hypothetical protein [Catenovulum agarivorans]EWH12191.1 hypothetical protein DS2_00670 [Catenovulum agarivorans DS-2]
MEKIKILFTAIIVLISASHLSGCKQASAYTQVSNNPPTEQLSKQTINQVKHTFHASFVYGDWRFQGVQVVKDSINAYIQIPDKLDMAEKQQKAYIQQVICPSAQHAQMWLSIKNHPLWVHLYTHDKRYGVYAECTNPHA